MMRENNEVCFEVDVVDNTANWRSVILNGIFEELKDAESQKKAANFLEARLTPLITSETARSKLPSIIPQVVVKEKKPIIYRIRVTKKSGRFEKTNG